MSRDAQPPCVSSLNEEMFGHDYPCLKSAYNGALLFENKAPVSQTTVEYWAVNYCFVNPW